MCKHIAKFNALFAYCYDDNSISIICVVLLHTDKMQVRHIQVMLFQFQGDHTGTIFVTVSIPVVRFKQKYGQKPNEPFFKIML